MPCDTYDCEEYCYPSDELASSLVDDPQSQAGIANEPSPNFQSLSSSGLQIQQVISLSPEHFIHIAHPKVAPKQASGWYEYPRGCNVGGNHSTTNHVVSLEDVLDTIPLHKKGFGKQSSIFGNKPRFLEKNEQIYDCAIYLGKLSSSSVPNWEGSIFLHLEIGIDKKCMAAAVGVMEETLDVSSNNSAFRKRLRELHHDIGNIYNRASQITVGGKHYWFASVNSSLKMGRNESLFIVFKSRASTNYDTLFGKVKLAFENSASSSRFAGTSSLPVTLRTIVSLDGVVHQRLQKTVREMSTIPNCPEIYKVKNLNKSDRGAKRIRKAPFDDDDDDEALYSDNDADDGGDLFPVDPELTLLKLPNKEDLFGTVISITSLSKAIDKLKSELENAIENPAVRTFFEGMVAAIFYSNLRWRLGPIDAVDRSLVEEKKLTSFDVDQMSLDVTFNMLVSRFSRLYVSNQEFLKTLYDELVDKVRHLI
jgi:hypothetical protein